MTDNRIGCPWARTHDTGFQSSDSHRDNRTRCRSLHRVGLLVTHRRALRARIVVDTLPTGTVPKTRLAFGACITQSGITAVAGAVCAAKRSCIGTIRVRAAFDTCPCLRTCRPVQALRIILATTTHKPASVQNGCRGESHSSTSGQQARQITSIQSGVFSSQSTESTHGG